MKKRFFWLLFFALFVITCFSFSACTEVADLGIKDPSAADPDSGKDKNSVCTTHIDIDKNKKCDKCGEYFIGDCATHKDSDDDHKCDYCAFVIGECRDENVDGICDACGKILRDNSTPPCVDSNKDGACDDCGKKIDCVECIDRDKNAVCDNCGGRVECAECIDENYNGRCDVCSAKVEIKPHDCKDENEDYVCDLCEDIYPCGKRIDKNVDGICDLCLLDMYATSFIDVNRNGICEICFSSVEVEEIEDCTECVDENLDGWCDLCGFVFFDSSYKIVDEFTVDYDSKEFLEDGREGLTFNEMLEKYPTEFWSREFARFINIEVDKESGETKTTYGYNVEAQPDQEFNISAIYLIEDRTTFLVLSEQIFGNSLDVILARRISDKTASDFLSLDLSEITFIEMYEFDESGIFAWGNYHWSRHMTSDGFAISIEYNVDTPERYIESIYFSEYKIQ